MSITPETKQACHKLAATAKEIHASLQEIRLKVEDDVKKTHPDAFVFRVVEDNPARKNHPLMEFHDHLLEAEAAALRCAEELDELDELPT
jgi:hypothetical protein